MLAACVAWTAVLPAQPAAAADLRVDFSELARLVQKLIGNAKLRLHNAPGGLFGLTPGSSLSAGDLTMALPLAPFERTFVGFKARYYLSEVNSTRIVFEPRAGAVRATLTFESDGPELVGECVTAFCPDFAMPMIEWSKPVVQLDLVPVRYGSDALSLKIESASVSGEFTAACRKGNAVCSAVRSFAQTAIVQLRKEANQLLKAQFNSDDVQKMLAAGLKPYLALGPVGEVEIRNVAVDARGVLVSFRFGG